MAFIKDEIIQEIRRKARIEDIIGQYLPIEKKGRSLKCVCPFHDDHDPSMSISTDKQIFKCFVCGTGGNVFQFVEKFEKISFYEAVVKVAEMIHYPLEVSLPSSNKPVDSRYSDLYKVLNESILYSQFQLESVDGIHVKEYLHKRGMSDEQINRFQLGYLPPSHRLHEFLTKKGYSDQSMIRTNLAILNERGLYDTMVNRLTIPIHDMDGNPVGFTARTMDKSDDRKYINTSETEIYSKGKLIYNYHRARNECKKQQNVIVVEGPMDLFAFDRVGISNVVATLGTACTKEQMLLLRKLSMNVILCYDGDLAGQNAIYKAGKLAIANGLHVQVANNKTGLDPDEIINSYGADELRLIVQKPLSWLEFVYRFHQYHYDLSNYNSKREYATVIMNELQQIKDAFDRSYFMNQLSRDTGFEVQLLQSLVVQNTSNTIKQSKSVAITKNMDGLLIAQYEIISQILLSNEAFGMFKDELGFLIDEDCQAIVIHLMEYYRMHHGLELADFLSHLEKPHLQKIVIDISESELFVKQVNIEVLVAAMQKVKDSLKKRQEMELKQQLQAVQDPQMKLKLMQQYIQMRKNSK